MIQGMINMPKIQTRHRDIYCEWTEDSDGTWNTDCKKSYIINDGTPVENGMKFCCFCGAKIVEVRNED